MSGSASHISGVYAGKYFPGGSANAYFARSAIAVTTAALLSKATGGDAMQSAMTAVIVHLFNFEMNSTEGPVSVDGRAIGLAAHEELDFFLGLSKENQVLYLKNRGLQGNSDIDFVIAKYSLIENLKLFGALDGYGVSAGENLDISSGIGLKAHKGIARYIEKAWRFFSVDVSQQSRHIGILIDCEPVCAVTKVVYSVDPLRYE